MVLASVIFNQFPELVISVRFREVRELKGEVEMGMGLGWVQGRQWLLVMGTWAGATEELVKPTI